MICAEYQYQYFIPIKVPQGDTRVIVNPKSTITLKISLRVYIYVRFTKLVLSLRVATCDK
jgi:hypothetical protein